MSSTDKDIEILALRHQLAVLQRQVDKPRFTSPDRAFLAALLHTIPRPTLRQLHLIVSPDTILRWHRDLLRLWVPETRPSYATCVYSWITPPSRSRLMTLISPVSGRSSGRSGAACARDLCGR